MKRIRHKFLWAGGVLAAGLALFFVEEHFRGRWELQHFRKAMAARGESLAIQDLIPPWEGEGENGFPEFIRAASRLADGSLVPHEVSSGMKSIAPGKAMVVHRAEKLPTSTQKVPTNSWEMLEADLARNADDLRAMINVLKSSLLRSQLDYDSGYDLLLPHLSRCKSATQWLSAYSLQQTHRERLDEALASIESMGGIERLLSKEPLIISQLVRVAIANIRWGATWEALQGEGWTEEQLRRLQQSWEEGDYVGDMMRALAMEGAMAVMFFEQTRDGTRDLSGAMNLFSWNGSSRLDKNTTVAILIRDLPNGDALFHFFDQAFSGFMKEGVYGQLWRFSWLDQDCARFLRELGKLIDALREARSHPDVRRCEKEIEQQLQVEEAQGLYDQLRFLLSKVMLASLSKIPSKVYRVEAQRALVLAAIGIKRYQNQSGELPADLRVLVPGILGRVPVDFMDGRPLRYRPGTDGTFLLYSVWEDGIDDGGDPRPPKEEVVARMFNGRDCVWPMPASTEEIAEFEARH